MLGPKIKAKELKFGKDARERMTAGVDKLADAVQATLGPGGRNAAIAQPGGVGITKDGVTVARSIAKLNDPYEDMGAQLVKSVAAKTADIAGDGTTTATVLARAILKKGLKEISKGRNATQVKRGMAKATDAIVAALKKQAMPCGDPAIIQQVATISANGDEEIGTIITDAVQAVGSDGIISVEEGRLHETQLELVKGLRFDEGYGSTSPYFITNQKQMKVELEEPYIMVVDHKIDSVHRFLPVLDAVTKTGKPLLVIADGFNDFVMSVFATNHVKGVLRMGATRFPAGFQEDIQHLAQDLAVFTGATVVSEQTGVDLEQASIEHLGSAEKVILTRNHTTIIKGKGSPKKINERIEQLRDASEKLEDPRLKEQLRKRLGKLTGGVAVIKAGGATEEEMKEKKDRLDDALSAATAAIQEGVVPGGGCALISSQKALKSVSGASPDEDVGIKIISDVLDAPFKQILRNIDEPFTAHLAQIKKSQLRTGFNAATKEMGDMVEMGVIDPAKVTIAALENAVSVASLILMTEVAVTDEQETEDNKKHP